MMAGPWNQRFLSSLSRTTSSGRYIRELDGLRFIAIFTVFYQHLQRSLIAYSHVPLQGGRIADAVEIWRQGVALFFVISGFILALPFASQRLAAGPIVSLKKYYLRRITRLEPPYIVSMLMFFTLAVLLGHYSFKFLLPHLGASLLYIHMLVYAHDQTGVHVNGVAWSLEVEVQFYIIAPLIALLFNIRNRIVRRSIVVALMLGFMEIFRVFRWMHIEMPFTVLDELPMFLSGFLLADIYLLDWKESPASAKWVDLIAVPAWLTLPFFLLMPHLPTVSVPFILLGMCILSFRSFYVRKFLGLRWITIIGGMCYSIYLMHFPLLREMTRHYFVPITRLGVTGNSLVYCLLFGAPTLAASIVFFLLMEKPCMQKDWPQRLWAWLKNGGDLGKSADALLAADPSLSSVPASATDPLPRNQPLP